MGFILTSVICGIFIERWDRPGILMIVMNILGMILGTIAAYTFGTVWFCYSTGTGVVPALSLCVFPFIIGDLVKMVIAVMVGPVLRKQLGRIGGN